MWAAKHSHAVERMFQDLTLTELLKLKKEVEKCQVSKKQPKKKQS